MLPKKRKIIYVLPSTLLLLVIFCSASEDAEMDVLLTVIRDENLNLPDRVNICPTRESVMPHFEAKTMNCSEKRKPEMCERNGQLISGYPCTCKNKSPLYSAGKRRCVHNVWLRKGCDLRFGSWRHSTGWVWDELDDPTPLLYLDDGHGIAGGFNVSNRDFELCSLLNVTALSKTGIWSKIDFRFEDFQFFVSRGYFHISWNTVHLDPESRDTITGRLLRFSIMCRRPEPKSHEDIIRDPLESCLTFKATGNYTIAADSPKRKKPEEQTNDPTIAIILGVIIPTVVIIGTVIIVVFLRRRGFGTRSNRIKFPFHLRARYAK
ncbi:uncharacterized protein LOC114520954 [Dendronephthya gigantea]|uniref:uncharacterized protein LOC114520954 n=1 Tax=Dendronephthya gigantea TaxID=151771 RepID=UPI00106AA71C|nr:uncharacterized protein LOC114520954 [Dendronephthya gigantea]XP_028397108.1 uncharacterized protein LOC114520954 [Dendronephthya gigantea]XP_028397109.1 uncharacterized protein LOC114520954 [Dendronephthya gigantea]